MAKEKDQKSWFKRHPVWTGILIFFIFSIIVGAFSSDESPENYSTGSAINTPENKETPQQTEKTPEIQKSWHEVTLFNGKNDKITDTFIIQGSKFKLIYTMIPENEFAIAYLTVYEEGYSFMTEMISLSEGTDSSIIYEGPGVYYLDMGAANLERWSVKVEDYY